MSKRITGESVDVNYRVIQDFFEERGAKADFGSKNNYVLFQDDDPELADRRDREEKKKISEILRLDEMVKGEHRVLDIGCGIGRWGEYLLERGYYYVGIDGSANLIKRGEENLMAFDNKKLIVGYFQELESILEANGETTPFQYVFVNGVFMYLNDADYEQALNDIRDVCAARCFIYSKESMGVEQRLTLDEIYSEGLKQEYSAIYRSIREYRNSQLAAWGGSFHLLAEGQLFDETLHNRKETTDYYYIWERTE